MSVWKGDDQIIISVIEARQFNLVKLIFAQLLQHISDGFGNPYAANTAVCLGLFQNKNGAGCLSRPSRKDVVDVLVIQSSQRGAFNPCQLLHDIEPRVIVLDFLLGYVYIVPRQTENFSDTQRTGKREVHADIQVCIPTGIQRFTNRFRVPNLAFPAFGFAEVCLIEGVLLDDIPAHGLIKGASRELEHLFHL